MKEIIRSSAVLVLLSVLIGACGGAATTAAPVPTEAPAPTEVTEATVAPAPTEPPAPAPTEPPGPAEPKILRIRFDLDISNLDPAFYPWSSDEAVMFSVGEGLVRYKPGTWEIENVLAESIQQSEDGLRVDFTLRPGVQFHQGYGEVTADDVKFSFERIAGLTEPPLESAYRGDWAALDHVEVTGKYTGAIVLKEPFAPLWRSTLPVSSGLILSRKAVEELGDEYATHPIGTGPYEFAEWVPNERVIVKRFDGYWGEPPAWDEIHYLPIPDDSAAEIALETGDLDFGLISTDSVERFQALPDFQVIKAATQSYTWVALNVQHPNLADINVRRAIEYGADVPAVIDAAYDGKWERACALLPPSMLGYWADAPCYDRDVEKAKEFLGQAGVDSADITLTILDAEADKAAAEVIQANLAEVGINVEIVVQDVSTYWDGGWGEKGLQERQMTYMTYFTNPDPYWNTQWFTCSQVLQWNWMYWCNEEFDSLDAQAIKELDADKRAALYIQMQQIWDQDVPTVWIAYPTLYFVSRAGLEPSLTPNGRIVPWDFR